LTFSRQEATKLYKRELNPRIKERLLLLLLLILGVKDDFVYFQLMQQPDNHLLPQGGDSGSLWIDLTNRRPVALNFASPDNDDGSSAIANHILDVANLFNIHFNV
jgi:hypothetical protein